MRLPVFGKTRIARHLLDAYGLNHTRCCVQRRDAVRLCEFDLTIAWPSEEWVLRRYDRLVALKTIAGCRLVRDGEGPIVARVEDVEIQLESADDVYILYEVFVNRVYNLHNVRPTTIVDIGMNIGCSALSFARNANVIVHGYELCEDTFIRAMSNLRRNPVLAERVHAHNVGVGGADRTVDYVYSRRHPGSSGLFPGSAIARQGSDAVTKRGQLVDAARLLNEIEVANPGRDMVLKVDCEGAEYEIIGRMAAEGVLGKVQAVMLEWHVRSETHDPQQLLRWLSASGHSCFSTRECADLGMIYAVNAKSGRA